MTTNAVKVDAESTEAFAGRIFESVLGLIDVWSIYVGDKLGLYDALAKGPLTRDELVSKTGTHRRYITEWLEQQVTTGFPGGVREGSGVRWCVRPPHRKRPVAVLLTDPVSD